MKMAENGGPRITRRRGVCFYSSSSFSLLENFLWQRFFFGVALLSLELICSIVSFDFFFFFNMYSSKVSRRKMYSNEILG